MKRILAVIMILMAFSVAAFAEEIDLASMSTKELLALHESLDSILEERFSCQLDVIYPGDYIVGQDIKEGSYVFSCTKVGMANFWILTTYATEDDYANRNSLARQNLQVNGQAQINLTDGMVLSVGDGLGVIHAQEKPSWAP
ncbi:MAG: hypothetical protein IJ523_07440 [Succinivibrionaceae bacterium]|nr:hypothetical protein [Succinivibrionaceae bacterium]